MQTPTVVITLDELEHGKPRFLAGGEGSLIDRFFFSVTKKL